MKGFFNLISSIEFTELFQRFEAIGSEHIPLASGFGRILAEDIIASESLPPFTRSTMDGFAVRAKDTFGCSESEPALLTVIGEVSMGQSGRQFSLKPGQAVRIWTGGELPVKGDGIVMIEYSRQLDEDTIEIFRPIAPGENTIRSGEDYEKDAPVLTRGRKLRPADLGVLAGLGITSIPVFKRPVTAIISTGDELVAPEQQPGPGQIRDINSTALAALVEESGGIPVNYGIVGDDAGELETACKNALEQADVLLLSGGSSVGQRDFTLQVFKDIPDSTLLAHGVSIRPGKPTILAAAGNKPLFGLPGNVASSLVVFFLFVRPLLRKLGGLPCDLGLLTARAVTDQQIPSTIGREEYVRVQLTCRGEDMLPLAKPLYGKSGLLNPLVKADGLLCVGRDVEGLDSGTEATVLLFP